MSLSKLREEYKNAPQFSSNQTHEAYIVKNYYTEKKFILGVAYFTKEEAEKGERKTEGNLKLTIIEKLYGN